MLIRVLTQVFLASSLFQLFPVDAATLERAARLPATSEARRPFPFDAAVSLVSAASLPPAADADRAPRKTDPDSLGVVTSAVSALVVDAVSGAVLFEKGGEEPRPIGSITKLMTALVFLEGDPDLAASASVLPEDVRTGGRQHLPVGIAVTAHDLLLASLVSSDNTATMSLARLSGLSEVDFVVRMNARAAELGMTHTAFADPTGLSSDNRSMPVDIVALLRAVLEEDTIRDATQRVSATVTTASGRPYFLETTNDLHGSFLDADPYRIVGGKTGYLPLAGYCLGMEVERNGDDSIFVVVLGSVSNETRILDAKALVAWAYKTYIWP
ncbi:D-alanyl-D-alanine carboxypeptidase [Candidatus Uhrbacteria bacterium]|nr:D-alanyl-D-alanine carboxypeptidase [Candidatus Uhrbacteria bacterium]